MSQIALPTITVAAGTAAATSDVLSGLVVANYVDGVTVDNPNVSIFGISVNGEPRRIVRRQVVVNNGDRIDCLLTNETGAPQVVTATLSLQPFGG